MNSLHSSGSGRAKLPAQPVLGPANQVMYSDRELEAVAAPQLGPRRSGYGLPCAKCKTYYAADLSVCPVCQTAERVSPIVNAQFNQPEPDSLAPVPDEAALEEERERFLQQFRAQSYASQIEINAITRFRCSEQENHPEEFEPAAVCASCYDHLQERADRMEAVLHMDLQEATQIVYDAVWGDPSDPSKTYQNAAQALLTALRTRAGISMVIGRFQRLPH
jgi:hypothetical protein